MPVTPVIFDDAQYAMFSWVSETGTGVHANVAGFSDITVQFSGTGTTEIEGSNDGTNWTTLTDTGGTPVTAAAAGTMVVLLEHPFFIRPVVSGGTATIRALASGNR